MARDSSKRQVFRSISMRLSHASRRAFGLPALYNKQRTQGDHSTSSEDGQALVEMAITFPLVAAFVFTMIEVCLAFYSFCMISECAREGTRYGIVRGATCVTSSNASCTASASSINAYVSQIGFPNLGAGTVTPTTTFPDGNQNPGSRVQVKVTYVFPVNLPFVSKNSISMASTSVMYIVQ
ncbi:MAG: TadE/TadG family type IV pilus assembly protein [Terracidiphilus sp.]